MRYVTSICIEIKLNHREMVPSEHQNDIYLGVCAGFNCCEDFGFSFNLLKKNTSLLFLTNSYCASYIRHESCELICLIKCSKLIAHFICFFSKEWCHISIRSAANAVSLLLFISSFISLCYLFRLFQIPGDTFLLSCLQNLFV